MSKNHEHPATIPRGESFLSKARSSDGCKAGNKVRPLLMEPSPLKAFTIGPIPNPSSFVEILFE